MNLWTIFPDYLLQIKGILNLPYFVLPFYLYVLYASIKHPAYRVSLILFLVVTLMASLIMVFSMGPSVGHILPPLLLLSVMLMPLVMLIIQMCKSNSAGIRLWSIVSVAGWVHSLSWAVWLMALARS